VCNRFQLGREEECDDQQLQTKKGKTGRIRKEKNKVSFKFD
jgi:hypothetical protein